VSLSPPYPGKELPIGFVLRAAPGDVPGEDPKQGQEQGKISEKCKNHQARKAANEIQDKAQDTQGPGQGVYSVAPVHKAADAVANSLKHGITSLRLRLL
jgi:hypothetical protein